MKKTSIGVSVIAALLLGASVQADMITVGGDQTAGTGTLTINQDITFEITIAAGQVAFVFDEIVASCDESLSQVFFAGLEYSINEDPRRGLGVWADNGCATQGDGTPNDGYLVEVGPASAVEVGDIVTLHAGTGIMTSSDVTFNPWSSGDYSLFLANPDANRISENGVVPEPATAGMLAISGLLIVAYRRYFGRV